jgi:hypothetical protein
VRHSKKMRLRTSTFLALVPLLVAITYCKSSHSFTLTSSSMSKDLQKIYTRMIPSPHLKIGLLSLHPHTPSKSHPYETIVSMYRSRSAIESRRYLDYLLFFRYLSCGNVLWWTQNVGTWRIIRRIPVGQQNKSNHMITK